MEHMLNFVVAVQTLCCLLGWFSIPCHENHAAIVLEEASTE